MAFNELLIVKKRQKNAQINVVVDSLSPPTV